MSKIQKSIILLVLLFSNIINAQSSNHFELTLTSPNFDNTLPNEAINIKFPSVRLWGWIEVTITSAFNTQLGIGKVTKRYQIGHNVGGYFNQSTEIPVAFGAIATQWAIGDFNHETNSIPIYHLIGTKNFLVIKIEGMLSDTNSDLMESGITLSAIETAVSPNPRHYMTIMQDRVGIGTNSPKNLLDVNGTVHSKEVKVDMLDWSDFVFKKEYELPTLEYVEKYIAAKGHLENIPSEEEVIINGINLGEMNGKLLQKIEELTLYSIQQQKEIEVLKSKLSRLDDLSNQIKLLLSETKKRN